MPPLDLLSLVGALVVIMLVLAGAYVFTRWAGTHLAGGPIAGVAGKRLKVLDRAALGKDQLLLMVQAGERYFLLGSTPAGVTLLAELSREEGEGWISPLSPDGAGVGKLPDFQSILQRLREKKQG
jgi:flagellar biogenesis protein FliO